MRSSTSSTLWRLGKLRSFGVLALIVLLIGVLAACQSEPAAEPAEEAPAVEAPAEEEAEAEATEPAEEEAEAEATEPAEEEADAEAEATEPAEEEAEAEPEATEPAEEEADAEATAPAEEEPEADATAEPDEEETGDAAMDDAVAMGGYLVTITGGCGCHMNRDLGGLAGGNEFETPSGIVYASNITPDEETGIGSWSEEEIAVALQTGATPGDHGQLHPVMPYMRLSVLSDQEALAIGAYLLSLEPLSNEVEHGDLSEEPAAYTPETAPPAEVPTDPVARGEQLVTITNCGGCHTPRDTEGMMLAGNMLREEWAKNITPDEATGIGSWSEEEIATYLQTGVRPDGSEVEGAMAQQIARRFSTLTDSDATAIAAYLKSIPAVENAAPSE